MSKEQSPSVAAANHFAARTEIAKTLAWEEASYQDRLAVLRADVVGKFLRHGALSPKQAWMVFDVPIDASKKEVLLTLDTAQHEPPLIRIFTNEHVTANGEEFYIAEDMVVDHEDEAAYFMDAFGGGPMQPGDKRQSDITYGTLFMPLGDYISYSNKPLYTPMVEISGYVHGKELLTIPFGVPNDRNTQLYALDKVEEILVEIADLKPREQSYA